jgi:hypothetical protein
MVLRKGVVARVRVFTDVFVCFKQFNHPLHAYTTTYMRTRMWICVRACGFVVYTLFGHADYKNTHTHTLSLSLSLSLSVTHTHTHTHTHTCEHLAISNTHTHTHTFIHTYKPHTTHKISHAQRFYLFTSIIES